MSLLSALSYLNISHNSFFCLPKSVLYVIGPLLDIYQMFPLLIIYMCGVSESFIVCLHISTDVFCGKECVYLSALVCISACHDAVPNNYIISSLSSLTFLHTNTNPVADFQQLLPIPISCSIKPFISHQVSSTYRVDCPFFIECVTGTEQQHSSLIPAKPETQTHCPARWPPSLFNFPSAKLRRTTGWTVHWCAQLANGIKITSIGQTCLLNVAAVSE